MATRTLAIERLTFGPDALARDGGRIVFVAGGAPGDRVIAEVTEERRGFLRARVREVLSAGPGRVEPRCPWIERCGGCPWQHVAPAAQLAAKRAVVAEQLERLGGLRGVDVLPALAASAPWRYRSRITLAVDGRRLGYHARGSRVLAEIDDCLLAHPALVEHLPAARRWVERLRAVPERVTLAVAPGGVVLHADGRARPGHADRDATETLLAGTASVRGAVLTGGGARMVAGDPTLRVALEPGCELEVPADAFTQVNPDGNRLLVRTVLELGAFVAGERALDLYCGAGNFALPIARREVAVTAVERSPVAVAAARANAARLGVRVQVVEGEVAAAIAALPPAPLDAVVLDPPRAGAAEALAQLAARRPARIVYVSCDPATLARDARTLHQLGWTLVQARPLDLFPHTHHVETVAEFRC